MKINLPENLKLKYEFQSFQNYGNSYTCINDAGGGTKDQGKTFTSIDRQV